MADELEVILREAVASVEKDLSLEDEGWLNLSGVNGAITGAERINNIKWSQLYAVKDPLGKQAIRLWTDYTFGSGITASTQEDGTKAVLASIWDNPANRGIFSAAGVRKSSNIGLIDGENFFAIFIGDQTAIRRIEALEITEIITNPDDKEDVRLYKREWTDTTGKSHAGYYKSIFNTKDIATLDSSGASRTSTEDAFVYHLPFNTISQRGNPLLLPALDWIKWYRKFLASRIAVMLALAKFAWKNKTKGGATQVATSKAVLNDKNPNAASVLFENMGSDTNPIRTDSNATNAFQDGRMIKLQVCAAVGISEQYFGDISTGSLATAQTVELPMVKMFESYQSIWEGAYRDMISFVLNQKGITDPEKMFVDIDFPAIAPDDVMQAADAIVKMIQAIPDISYADEVRQLALTTLGINNPQEVLDQLTKDNESMPEVALSKELKKFEKRIKESIDGRKQADRS